MNSWSYSCKYAAEQLLDDMKHKYNINGDNNIYKNSHIYKAIHQPIYRSGVYDINRIPIMIDIDDRLRIIRTLINLGAKVDYKTTYFEDSILYDFMHMIELYNIHLDHNQPDDKRFNNNNTTWYLYWDIFNLLLSKNIQDKFKTDATHTLTPGKYSYKLHIQNEIVNYYYNKYKK